MKQKKNLLIICCMIWLLALSVSIPSYASTLFDANSNNLIDSGIRSVDGIQSSMRFYAENRTTGVREYSSYSANPANRDILTKGEYTNLGLEARIENTSITTKTINFVLTLPLYNEAYAPNPPVLDNTYTEANLPVTTNSTNVRVRYAIQPGKYRDLARLKAEQGANFAWSKVRTIQFDKTLAAGEYIDIDLHFDDASLTTIGHSFSAAFLVFAPAETSYEIGIISPTHLYDVEDMMYGVYAGAYRDVAADGRFIYRQVPEEVQKAMPEVKSDNFIFDKFASMYTPGVQLDLTKVSDTKAYSTSQYIIKTDLIFNAVKDLGFSTYVDNTRGFWNAYTYTMTAGLNIRNEAGNPLVLGQTDSYGVELSNYYVELHKIFETKDITLYEGDAWDIWDNLLSATGINSQKDNYRRVIPHSEIDVEHNVDNMTRGTYSVKYLHDVYPGRTVTKTAQVIVLPRPHTPSEPDEVPTEPDKASPSEPDKATPSEPDKDKDAEITDDRRTPSDASVRDSDSSSRYTKVDAVQEPEVRVAVQSESEEHKAEEIAALPKTGMQERGFIVLVAFIALTLELSAWINRRRFIG